MCLLEKIKTLITLPKLFLTKMKNIILTILIVVIAGGCSQPGATEQKVLNSELLPRELKGLKIYRVTVDNLGYSYVAVLNNDVNSVTYREGKVTKTMLMVNQTGTTIPVEQILMENDSMIICRK